MTSLHDRTARLRESVVPGWLADAMPDWLTEAVRPKPAPVPWGAMVRAALAICVPLSVGMVTGHREVGLVPAIGGLLDAVTDTGGPYVARVTRVVIAAVFGGAVGLVIGMFIHHRGWVAVASLVVVAGVSALISRLGSTGSVTGLQLLVYTALGLGPFGALRPWWSVVLGFLAGVAWALLLLVPGWLLSPRFAEQSAVADVYRALADDLRAIGTGRTAETRRAVTAALDAAYDSLLTARATAGGRSRRTTHLMAVLNASSRVSEAVITLRREGTGPPPLVADVLDRLADAIAAGGPLHGGPHPDGTPLGMLRLISRRWAGEHLHGVPPIPPPWSSSPGSLELRDALAALTRTVAWTPATSPEAAPRAPLRERARAVLGTLLDQLLGGRLAWTFTVRLMVCVGVAAVASELLPLQRSYWVVLTVAIVLKPDNGSVFARALQRGIGTTVGAVLGAVILVAIPYGLWLLLPIAVLAAGMPYGRLRNFGLVATLQTPVVVLLVDLLAPSGWRLAEERLVDTLLGCAIVLLVGYAPWPSSWHAYLPRQFAATLRDIDRFTEAALIPDQDPAARGRGWQLRRTAYRALSDLRAEYQRAMSEPAAVSRRASAWWPAIVAIDEVVDAATATGVAIRRGAPAPSPEAVHQLTAALSAVADAIDADLPPRVDELPDDEAIKPVTDAVRPLLSVLGSGPRPTRPEAAVPLRAWVRRCRPRYSRVRMMRSWTLPLSSWRWASAACPMGMDVCARRRSRPPASRAIASSRAPGARSGVGWDSATPKSAAAGSDRVMTRSGPPVRAIASARTPFPAASNTASTAPSARTRSARPGPYRTGVAPSSRASASSFPPTALNTVTPWATASWVAMMPTDPPPPNSSRVSPLLTCSCRRTPTAASAELGSAAASVHETDSGLRVQIDATAYSA